MQTLFKIINNAMAHPALESIAAPRIQHTATLPAWFEVTDLATATMGAAVSALQRYRQSFGASIDTPAIDQRLLNLWFGFTLKPIDFELAPAWDSVAGDYPTQDGWIRLHTNAAHHKAIALAVLGCDESREAVGNAVSTWQAETLEAAIVAAGGCAATMRSIEQWQQHEHGKYMLDEPLIRWQTDSATQTEQTKINIARPLDGVKVLDLTRVLAGPVAGRFLAGYGANVLRIDPPGWEEPAVVPEVTLGKRCAELNLKNENDRRVFIELLKSSDIILHGYRADALAKLGFDEKELRTLNPNLIQVCLNAYGWQGPWQNRRGFDSLLQMSTGIAHYGMEQANAQKPTPLPVQALDHATGYLMAAAAIQALEVKAHHQQITNAKLSLAATAHQLIKTKRKSLTPTMPELNSSDFAASVEQTTWGQAKRVRFPVSIPNAEAFWPSGACALRTSSPSWG